MSPDPQSESVNSLQAKRDVFVRVLRCVIGYCTLSCLTLPFVGLVWLGELPVLALVQLPKIALAGWLRTQVVMKAITFLGFSRGSFSPDYILARPYALAITYLIPVIILLFIGQRLVRPVDARRGFVMLALLVAMAADYVFTIIFAEGRLLTIY